MPFRTPNPGPPATRPTHPQESRPIRVLYVLDSLARGGSESSVAAVAPYLAAEDIELELAYLHERAGLHDDFRSAGVLLHPPQWRGDLIRTARSLASLVRARRPDLVHTTLFEADLTGRAAAVAAGVPVVSSLVTDAWGPIQRTEPDLRLWKVRAAQLLDAGSARAVVRFHALTQEIASTVPRRIGVARSRIEVVPRGRDRHLLGRRTGERRAAARRALGIHDDRPLVLAVARHEHPKGLDVLLEAVAVLRAHEPEVVVVVAGREGNETPNLRARITRLHLEDRVHLLGPRSDVPDLLCAADVAVFPSRREGMPGAVIEAMALEAPIVSTDTLAAREVLGDGSSGSLLVPAGDAGSLAAAVAATLGEPAAAVQRAILARRRFEEHFTVERAAVGMRGFYDRALASTRWPAHRHPRPDGSS